MEFRLHPLVLLNISDHHTRSVPCSPRSSLALPLARPCRHATLTALPRSFKAQLAGLDTPRVLGLLLGTHTARTVEISNSFEIKYDGFLNDVPQLDHAFLVQKQEQCAQLMGVLMRHRPLTLSTPRQEGLPKAGRRWLVLHRQRSAGRGPGAAASGAWALVHGPLRLSRPLHLSCEQLTAVTESPVYALFNPVVLAAKELPITLYESGARGANKLQRPRTSDTYAPPRRATRGERGAVPDLRAGVVHDRGARRGQTVHPLTC